MQQDLERVARNRYGLWISSVLLILALAGFVALAIYFAPQYVAGLTGWQLVASLRLGQIAERRKLV